MPDSFAPWGRLFGALAIDAALIVAATLVLQRFVRTAAWRRTFWQVALLGLACISVAEISGVKRFAMFASPAEAESSPSGQIVFQTSTDTAPDLASIATKLRQASSKSAALTLAADAVAPLRAWWPGWIWLVGCSAVAIWMAAARLMFVCFVRRNAVRDDAVVDRAHALAHRLGLRRRVAVCETPGLVGPIAFGIIRPGISLPVGFRQRFSVNQQEAMLAHELAHLAARDPLWHAIADGLAALLWWHPLVWVARRQLRAASEAAADEASLLVENGPAVLAECLVELGGRLTRARSLGWLGMEGGEFRSGLGRRVKRLVTLPGRPWKPIRRTSDWLAKTMGVTALVVLALATTAWLQPSDARSDSFRQAFKESVLGLVLVAAMPIPQAENAAPLPGDGAVLATESLHTRWFKIDPTTTAFVEAMRGWLGTNAVSSHTNRAVEVAMSDLRRIFDLAGVDMARPKSVLFNHQLGQLMVRASLQDLDVVEQLIQVLNAPLPQITIEVKICEMPEGATRALGFDWFPVRVSSNAIPRPPGSTGILTDPQNRVVQTALAQRTDVKITELPRVTTLSGRQAQLKAVRLRYIVTGSSGGQPMAEPFELGPVVDIVPVVRPDGHTIGMTIKASLQEFEGYDSEGGTRIVTTADGRKEIVKTSDPNPIFRKRELVSDAIVLSGQTIVLFDGSDGVVGNQENKLSLLGDLPVVGQMFRDKFKQAERTNLVIFVTPTLIDPAGNKISPK